MAHTTWPLAFLHASTHEGKFCHGLILLTNSPPHRPSGSNINSFARGRRQTSHIHQSSHRLRPAILLFGHSPLPKLARCSELLSYLVLTLYVSLHTWCTIQWPQSLPVLRESLSPDSVFTLRRFSAVLIHPQLVVAMDVHHNFVMPQTINGHSLNSAAYKFHNDLR